MNKFEEYYRNNLVGLPPRANFRQFKILLENGKMIKLRDIIKDPITLRNYLVRWKPVQVYYSVAEFYQPYQVGCKPKNNRTPGGTISKNMFLRGDFTLEIDSKDKDNVLKAVNILKKLGFEDLYFVESHRGIHIHVYDFWEKIYIEKNKCIAMPGDREHFYFIKKVFYAKILRNNGVDFDFDTTIDTRRVIGLPFSLHKKGVIRFGNSVLEEVISKWN